VNLSDWKYLVLKDRPSELISQQYKTQLLPLV